jgi:rhamnose utilization protein RhaD (predicted bifunctional aldolase and dehydrogenase)
MRQSIKKLVEISRKFGKDKNYTIAGGGNTSFKTDKELWVKASGYGLANITEEGFVRMDRKKLDVISSKEYSEEPFLREREVKDDLEKACIDKGKRPSVETSLHNALDYAFVIHMHPFLINAILCSNDVEQTVERLWGNDVLYVPYTDPGYVLFKEVEAGIDIFRGRNGYCPKVILLQNHGIFVGADMVEEVEMIYTGMMNDILQTLPSNARSLNFSDLPFELEYEVSLPDEFLKSKGLLFKGRNNRLIERFSRNRNEFSKISAPFTPDIIVYCKSNYLFIETSIQQNSLAIENAIVKFHTENGYFPKILVLQGMGLVSIGESEKQVNTALDVFEDQMKIAWFSDFFGGQHFMEPLQINFIDSWEVENYRRKISG